MLLFVQVSCITVARTNASFSTGCLPRIHLSISVPLCSFVNLCIIQSSLSAVCEKYSVYDVLYGWLEGTSKFLLSQTPCLSLFSLFPKNTTHWCGFFKPQTCTHVNTHIHYQPCPLTFPLSGEIRTVCGSFEAIYTPAPYSSSVCLSVFLCDSLLSAHKKP